MTGDFFFGSYDDSQERKKVKTDQPVGTFFFFLADLFAKRVVVWRIYSLTSGKWNIFAAAWRLGLCMSSRRKMSLEWCYVWIFRTFVTQGMAVMDVCIVESGWLLKKC